jgi:hypothetical protein
MTQRVIELESQVRSLHAIVCALVWNVGGVERIEQSDLQRRYDLSIEEDQVEFTIHIRVTEDKS